MRCESVQKSAPFFRTYDFIFMPFNLFGHQFSETRLLASVIHHNFMAGKVVLVRLAQHCFAGIDSLAYIHKHARLALLD